MPRTFSHLSSLYFGDMLLLAATKKKKDMKVERNSLEREKRSMGGALKGAEYGQGTFYTCVKMPQ